MKSVIITGSTGMIGKGVLLECLDHPAIKQVLIINRTSIGMTHPKLKEVLLKDFTQVASIKEQLTGYDACLFCMGVSAMGMSARQYTDLTFAPVRSFADVLYELNPDLVFNYISGSGTDSSESGRSMWARVKGRTENYVLEKGFKDAYMFRIGMVIPERGIESKVGWYSVMYKIMRPFYPLFKKLSSVTTTSRVGLAMINSMTASFEKKHLENKEINELARE